jgi:plasmid maintenance system antidote protein VapI
VDTVEELLRPPIPTAADFRAAIARHRLKVFHLGSLINLHPSKLSRILNERAPLTRDIAERLARAIEEEAKA